MDQEYWFSKKNHKFLHQIDTFYFSVKLQDDLTKDAHAPNVVFFREHLKRFDPTSAGCIPFKGPQLADHLNVIAGHYSQFYTFRLEHPGMYDIFIAPVVPEYETSLSVTSEIIVQIRSKMLWEMGVTKAFERCMKTIHALCDFYNFTILEVKENRTDFCWHTNALQDPENYLRIDKLAQMQVSRFKRVRYDYQLKADDQYESDYVAFGKRGDKCYLRFYLKTKEVVEMQQKPWFFQVWLFNELISRYDFYVLDLTYKKAKWTYVDCARLHFALDYMELDPRQRAEAERLLAWETSDKDDKSDYAAIAKLADILTPKLTKILNVEYQTMRRMTKSFQLLQLKDNSDKGVCQRIYDFLDNRKLITDYLTNETFRLVNRGDDSNKSRCEYTDFWQRLRNTKQVDVSMPKQLFKLCREYSHNISEEMRRKRALHAIISYGAVTNGSIKYNVFSDAEDLLCMLNDNDVANLTSYKQKQLIKLPRGDINDFDASDE